MAWNHRERKEETAYAILQTVSDSSRRERGRKAGRSRAIGKRALVIPLHTDKSKVRKNLCISLFFGFWIVWIN